MSQGSTGINMQEENREVWGPIRVSDLVWEVLRKCFPEGAWYLNWDLTNESELMRWEGALVRSAPHCWGGPTREEGRGGQLARVVTAVYGWRGWVTGGEARVEWCVRPPEEFCSILRSVGCYWQQDNIFVVLGLFLKNSFLFKCGQELKGIRVDGGESSKKARKVAKPWLACGERYRQIQKLFLKTWINKATIVVWKWCVREVLLKILIYCLKSVE